MKREALLSYSTRIALLGVIFSIGVHVDGWAHNHGRVDESFFTPWHALLYGTYFVVAIAILAPILGARSRGESWSEAIPAGYGWSLLGLAVFFVGGVGDLLWHTAFGVEEDLEALLSPTHLTLAAGGMAMGVGPYLAGLRSGIPGWRGSAPAVLTALAFLSFLGFMTQHVSPYAELWPTAGWQFTHHQTDQIGQALGTAGFLWTAALLSGIALPLEARGRLPGGGLALLVAGSSGFAVTQGDDYWLVVPALVAGIALEGVRRVVPHSAGGFRVLSFLVGLLPFGAHMAALALFDEVAWSTHLWAGTPVMTGLVALLVGFVAVAPGSARPVGADP